MHRDRGVLLLYMAALIVLVSLSMGAAISFSAATHRGLVRQKDQARLSDALGEAARWADAVMANHTDADWAVISAWAAQGGLRGGAGDGCRLYACWMVSQADETVEAAALVVAGRGAVQSTVRHIRIVAAVGCSGLSADRRHVIDASVLSSLCREVSAEAVLSYGPVSLPQYARLSSSSAIGVLADGGTAVLGSGYLAEGAFFNAETGGLPPGCTHDASLGRVTCANSANLAGTDTVASDDLTIGVPSGLDEAACSDSRPHPVETWATAGRSTDSWPPKSTAAPPRRLEDAPPGSLYVVPARANAANGMPQASVEISGTAPGPVTIVTPGSVRVNSHIGAPPGSALVIIAGCVLMLPDPEPGSSASDEALLPDEWVLTINPVRGSAASIPAGATGGDFTISRSNNSVTPTDGSVTVSAARTTAGRWQATVAGLAAGQHSYEFWVRPKKGTAGSGPAALEKVIMPAGGSGAVTREALNEPTAPVGAPRGLTWRTSGSGTVSLSWAHPASGKPALYEHRHQQQAPAPTDGSSHPWTAWQDFSAEESSAGEAELASMTGTRYAVEVRAKTAGASASQVTVYPGQPDPVAGLTVAASGPTGAVVSWLAPGSVVLERVLIVAAGGLWMECLLPGGACDVPDASQELTPVQTVAINGSLITGQIGSIGRQSAVAGSNATGYGYRMGIRIPPGWETTATAWWPLRHGGDMWQRRAVG